MSRGRFFAVSIAAAVALGVMPGAAEAGRALPRLAQSSPPAPKTSDCTCRSPAGVFELGDVACLRTPNGMRLARCVMVLNNTSWQFTDDLCPQSGLQSLRPPG